MQAAAPVVQVMAVLDAMPSSNLRPEDDSEVEASRVYRTTYMFSATMPPSVERLARKCGLETALRLPLSVSRICSFIKKADEHKWRPP